MNKPRILILGAGYGGMMTTTQLVKRLHPNDAEIILVNKNNYHYQSTWLHEPAAGTLPPERTRMLIEDVINTNRVQFIQDSVTLIKKDEKKVVLESYGEIDYDYLVIGLGFESETFGIPGLREHASTIEDVNTVREIKERIEYQFACYLNNPERKAADLTIVVGGGGFTGVEFLGELSHRIPELCRDYDIDPSQVKLINVEGSKRILPGFDEELAQYAINRLQKRGVEFIFNTHIVECQPGRVFIQEKGSDLRREIEAGIVIWTGGIRGNSVVEKSGFDVQRGRLKVDQDLRAPGYDTIFVIGDCALFYGEGEERPYPPTAQIAIQQSFNIATNIKHLLNGEPTKPFVYKSKGTVASLGHGDAIGVVFDGTKLKGTSASAMKKIIDDRYLFLLGGVGLVLKKGKLNLFK
ncbi:NAD(P)/FAD-dependent oxidoreductase [Pullulanibacillus sp. KACC 23026]|uniref:NAD(P)/FAD-dependent oxidoreductase n=1 Tax=Pullulanibacillus sp. KACC 23026 TaxID=3028315 RepID=UPI0023B0F2C9|nr:NAD(P)/FAD-dependent oxidoreductase [Pullulanibacillus sp. KACC 23026]WEG13787.1 NAD(P)/FAD-dependent oxidoreductase [Pullulanibacillus sp. KACC 23026]